MLRNVGAVVAGLLVGAMANMAIIMGSWMVYPPPDEIIQVSADQEALAAFIGTLPTGVFLVAIVAHLAQAGIGGWLAARLGSSRPLMLSLIVGALSLVGGLMNLFSIPGPWWMWIEVPLYLVVSGAAGQQVARSRETSSSM